MRILISGGRGFVGGALASFFISRGDEVVRLVRKATAGPDCIQWDPDTGKVCKEEFEGFDAVFHLAGEPLTLERWNRKKQEQILFSRTVGTWLLSHVLSQLMSPPKVFVCASAVGFYGNRGEEILTEESSAGKGFLANVCCEWEKASRAAENRGVRTIHSRFGMVVGPNGGALQKMMLPYRLGLGARNGDGMQWISWIDRDDLIRAMAFLLESPDLEGPVNFVSPHPVRQETLSRELSELLHRPAFLHLPVWLLRLLFGMCADEILLSSTRVLPAKLDAAGFVFQTPLLIDALRKALQSSTL